MAERENTGLCNSNLGFKIIKTSSPERCIEDGSQVHLISVRYFQCVFVSFALEMLDNAAVDDRTSA